MELYPSAFMPLVSAISDGNFEALIDTRNPNDWRETLAMVSAYVDDITTWSTYCDMLATKLFQCGLSNSAALCFICAGNVDRSIDLWLRQKENNLKSTQVRIYLLL